MTAIPNFLKTVSLDTAGLGQIDIEINDDIAKFEADWRLLERQGVCSLYQRFDWINAWTSNVAAPARMQPRTVVGRQGDELMFILPLGLRKRGPFTVATWLGDSHSNFHMGLFAKTFIQKARRQDVRDMMKCVTGNMGRADVLEMCCQPVVWQGFTNPFTFLDWQESHNHAFALDLSEGFDAAINRKNGARKRKKYRWQQNKLADVGGAHLKIAGTEAEVDAIMDVAFAQMAQRFDRAGIWNRFEDDGIPQFMRQTAKTALQDEEPQLMIYGLEIDGKIRATMAGGIHQGQFSGCFISLADDEYSHISPGELIIHLVIRDCVDRGLQMFDLGRGEERYKSSWCDTTITMFETNKALSSWGIGFAIYERSKLAAKRLVRNNQTLWNFAKKVRARLYGRM
jgi:CelD/BcsL family acetyltransferase involved in cellulose biosynthesis